MKKLLFLMAYLVALASQPVMAQVGGAQVIVVRAHESGGKILVAITRGESKTEVVTFDGSFSEKGTTAAAEGYQKIVAKLYQEGYALKSTFSGSQGSGPTLVFVKEK